MAGARQFAQQELLGALHGGRHGGGLLIICICIT